MIIKSCPQFNRIVIPSPEGYCPAQDYGTWVWMKELICLRKAHPAVSRLAEGAHCPANTLADWHKVLTQPQWRHLTPRRPGSPLPFTGVTPWRGDTLPSLPISWLGSNPARGSHGSPAAGFYCARSDEMHHGWRFSGDRLADLQLNRRVCISMPSSLSDFSQLRRGIWCFPGIPGAQGDRKEASQQQESWRHSRVIPFNPLLQHEWACVTRRDPVTKRERREGKPTPPTCLMWARFIALLPKITTLDRSLKAEVRKKKTKPISKVCPK